MRSGSRHDNGGYKSRYRITAASVTEAETMLGYTKIVAPFDGVVTRKLADVGDLATPGRPLLELDNPKALRLEADVQLDYSGGFYRTSPS